MLLLLAGRALLVWSERGGAATSGTIIIGYVGCVAELSLKLHDLFILDLDQVDQHLLVFLIHLLIIEARITFFYCRKLHLLQLDNLCSVTLFHLDLSLPECLILGQTVLILGLEIVYRLG